MTTNAGQGGRRTMGGAIVMFETFLLLFAVLIVVCVLAWAIWAYLPMIPPEIKSLICFGLLTLWAFWALFRLGVLDG